MELDRLHELEAIGKELADAAALAAQCKPDTVGARAATARADAGVDRLAVLDWPEEIKELVRFARMRVRNGRTVRMVDERALRREATAKRG